MVDREKAAKLALYAMYAEDLFDDMIKISDSQKHGTPSINGVLTDGTTLNLTNWEVAGEIRASDPFNFLGIHLSLFGAGEYNFGFLLKRLTDDPTFPVAKGDYLAMVRGTELTIEWIDDATIGGDTITLANGAKADAWTGFYSIYNTMILVRTVTGGLPSRMLAAEGISEVAGGAKVTVVGHSLGAALATYLTYDLARQDIGGMGNRVSGWFFASPKPATQAYADSFATIVSDYSLVNWQRDLVPDTPGPPFVQLSSSNNNVLKLTPADTTSQPKDTPTCNHHAICYAQMLYPLVGRDTHYGCFGGPITT
jgi:hypothetical protein